MATKKKQPARKAKATKAKASAKTQATAKRAPAGREGEGQVIAITGAFGFLGRKLIRRLEADPSVERIVAIDVRDPLELARKEGEPLDPATFLARHSRLSAHQLDLTVPGAERELVEIFRTEGVSSVCHLAFLSNPTHAEELAHELETIGTMYVLHAAQAAGVFTLTSLSSTMCYGARPDNPAWLTEDHPLRAPTESRFLRDRLDAERQVRRFAEQNPKCATSIVRLGIVLGGGTSSFWARYLGRPVVPKVMGYDPLFQILHADDAARGLYAVLAKRPRGALNLVGRGVLPLSRVIERLGHVALPVPAGLGRSLLSALWGAQLVEMPPALLDYLRWSWVCEGKRMREVVGFSPRYSTEEALAHLEAISPDEESLSVEAARKARA